MIRALFGINDERRRREVRPGNRGEQRTDWTRRELLTLRRNKPGRDGRWRIVIDPKRCADCQACARICRSAALTRSERSSEVLYAFSADLCDGCGDCRTVCAAQAVAIRHEEQYVTATEAARLPLAPCGQCHQLVAQRISGLCAVCHQSTMGLSGRLGRQ